MPAVRYLTGTGVCVYRPMRRIAAAENGNRDHMKALMGCGIAAPDIIGGFVLSART